MSIHLLRVVLASGAVTELMFNAKQDACVAAVNVRDTGMAEDEYGHDFSGAVAEIAALIVVDFDAEVAGQKYLAVARMRMNLDAQQEAAGARNGLGLVRALPGNGLLHG